MILLRPVLKVCLAFILVVLPLTCAEGKVANANKKSGPQMPVIPPVVVTYDIYVGGLHFVTADILFAEESRKYHTHIRTQTYGFWHGLLPWDATLDADGRIQKDHFVPSYYENVDIWRKKSKTTRLTFDVKGNVVPSFDPPNTDQNREVVTAEQRFGSLDPVTGLLQMLAHVAMEKNCNVTVPLFDGKRRFDVTGSDDGTESIDEEDYNAYKGPARLCKADFKMISGDWIDREKSGFWKLNDKEEGREPFHIWLAPLVEGLPEMPVRLQSGSIWGLIVMHLTRWRYANADDMAH